MTLHPTDLSRIWQGIVTLVSDVRPMLNDLHHVGPELLKEVNRARSASMLSCANAVPAELMVERLETARAELLRGVESLKTVRALAKLDRTQDTRLSAAAINLTAAAARAGKAVHVAEQMVAA
jgi:hypothetical protein